MVMVSEARFRAIFRVAYPALGRYAHNRGFWGADADDLVAETLEVVWRRLDQVKDNGGGRSFWPLIA
jgi:DNA-directed RNA polymerase specialized sigma24 family protein